MRNPSWTDRYFFFCSFFLVSCILCFGAEPTVSYSAEAQVSRSFEPIEKALKDPNVEFTESYGDWLVARRPKGIPTRTKAQEPKSVESPDQNLLKRHLRIFLNLSGSLA